MTLSDEEDELLANFLESELSDEDKPEAKRLRVLKEEEGKGDGASSSSSSSNNKRIDSGRFSQIPPELFITHILKYPSSEDLASCSQACSFLNDAVSDESLWRRLYCMRWGMLPPITKMRHCRPWKKLYIQRDEEDMIKLVRNCPSEMKEYYIQMQAAKRSQAPLPASQVKERSVGDQVSMWKSSRGLTDNASTTDRACSGETCSFYHIAGDAFVCEKTGQVHVCDDACRQLILDPKNEFLVCTISGHSFYWLLSPSESVFLLKMILRHQFHYY